MSHKSSPFPFLELIESLKNIPRKGWVIRGLHDTESVADHMYRMAIMCSIAPGFDDQTRRRAMKMALIHDIGEAIIGDVTPSDGMSREEKHTREALALDFITASLRPADASSADEILDIWKEYEHGTSTVAKLVHHIDKLECIDQAILYEERSGKDMGDFMPLCDLITLPELQDWLQVRLQDYKNLKLRSASNATILFISGGPGVGKGTQCELLVKEFGFLHLSVGDILRTETSNPSSPYQAFILESIKKSVLIPAQLTTLLIRENIERAQAEGHTRFLLDGFPRSISQAESFHQKISNKPVTVSLECSEEALRSRLEQRAQSSQRVDDNPDTVVLRLRTFQENNTSVLKYLEQHGDVHRVDCSMSIPEVHASLRQVVKSIIGVKDEARSSPLANRSLAWIGKA